MSKGGNIQGKPGWARGREPREECQGIIFQGGRKGGREAKCKRIYQGEMTEGATEVYEK